MSNPYKAPKATVDRTAPPTRLPGTVQLVRGIAITVDALVAALALLVLATSRAPDRFEVGGVAAVLVMAATSIPALASRAAGLSVFWTSMAANGLMLAAVALLFVRDARPLAFLLLASPPLLNIGAIEQLRRARAATK